MSLRYNDHYFVPNLNFSVKLYSLNYLDVKASKHILQLFDAVFYNCNH